MNKRVLIIGGLGVVAGLSLALFFGITQTGMDERESAQGNAVESSAGTISTGAELDSGLTNLKSLIERGQTLACDYSHMTSEGVTATGMVFLAGENFRIDSNISDPAQGNYVSHMIFADEMFYAWSEGLSEDALGLSFPATQRYITENTDTETITATPVSLEDEVEFSCREWSVDGTVFTPPSDIEFFDPTAMFLPQ